MGISASLSVEFDFGGEISFDRLWRALDRSEFFSFFTPLYLLPDDLSATPRATGRKGRGTAASNYYHPLEGEQTLDDAWLSVGSRDLLPSGRLDDLYSRRVSRTRKPWMTFDILGNVCLDYERFGGVVRGPILRELSPYVSRPHPALERGPGGQWEPVRVSSRSALPPASHPSWREKPGDIDTWWMPCLDVSLSISPFTKPNRLRMGLILESSAWSTCGTKRGLAAMFGLSESEWRELGHAYHPSLTDRCLEANWHSLIDAVRRLAVTEDAVRSLRADISEVAPQLEGTSIVADLMGLPKLDELEGGPDP